MYVAVMKNCSEWCYEEMYQILSGSTVLKTNPASVSDEQRTDEYCIPSTTSSQYRIILLTSFGSS